MDSFRSAAQECVPGDLLHVVERGCKDAFVTIVFASMAVGASGHGLRWDEMPRTDSDQPIQETQPKEGRPTEIPIPTRDEVFRNLDKVAKPRKTATIPEDREGRPEE